MMKTLQNSFIKLTDFVSEFIGTPANISFWVFILIIWTGVFVINPGLQNSSFLPTWFTSQAYNFPLNTVTTVVELFIGFLCAAATNRAEKALRQVLSSIQDILSEIKSIDEEEEKQTAELLELTREIHSIVTNNKQS